MRTCIARRTGASGSRCARRAAGSGRGVPKCPKMSHLERSYLRSDRSRPAVAGPAVGCQPDAPRKNPSLSRRANTFRFPCSARRRHMSSLERSPTRLRRNPRLRVGLTHFASLARPGGVNCREMSRNVAFGKKFFVFRHGMAGEIVMYHEMARNGAKWQGPKEVICEPAGRRAWSKRSRIVSQ